MKYQNLIYIYLLTRVICIYLPIYDGIWNRKTYFEITVNFECATSRAVGNSNKNKEHKQTLQLADGRNFIIIFPALYPYHI